MFNSDMWAAGAILIEIITKNVYSKSLSGIPLPDNRIYEEYKFLLLRVEFDGSYLENSGK